MKETVREEPEDMFTRLAEHFAEVEGVAFPGDPDPRGFGAGALKVHGSIFAMVVRGQLVLKLPAGRVDALVDSALAQRFDANRGRPMREWAVLMTNDWDVWAEVAEEALDFVGSRPSAGHARSPRR